MPEGHDERVTRALQGDLSLLTRQEKTMFEAQERFFSAMREVPTKTHAAKAAGVHISTVKQWDQRDALGYRARLEDAMQGFKDYLVEKGRQLIAEMGVKNSPLLLLAYLNAYLPERFKPGLVMTDDSSKDILAELKKLSSRQRKPEAPPEVAEPETVTETVDRILRGAS